MTDATKLPPLPEPDGYVAMTPRGSVIVPPQDFAKHNAYAVFSGAQVRAYTEGAIAAARAKLLLAEAEALRLGAEEQLRADRGAMCEAVTSHIAQMNSEIEALRKRAEDAERDAARYRYLRNRDPEDVLKKRGREAGVWIDCESEGGALMLVTGHDADNDIDAAIKGSAA